MEPKFNMDMMAQIQKRAEEIFHEWMIEASITIDDIARMEDEAEESGDFIEMPALAIAQAMVDKFDVDQFLESHG